MVQVAPNWADIEGRVAACANRAEETQGFAALTIEVSAVHAVEGFRCMVSGEDGPIRVLIPMELYLALQPAPGQRIQVRVRRAGPERVFYAHRERLRLLPT